MSNSHAANRRTRRVRSETILLWAALVLAGVGVAVVAWVGARALLAKGELEAAVPLATQIQSQLLSGDGVGADRTLAELSRHADRAADLTDDPVWRSFEILPWIGPNLTAVRQIASVVDDVSRNAVRPIATVAGAVQLSAFRPVGGAINVQPLVDAQADVAFANAALRRVDAMAKAIDVSSTLSPVRNAANRLKTVVADAARSVAMADRAVRLVPAMLGADYPRNYVLMFQNPAELRSTGGIAGAVAQIHTENGRIDLVKQASSSDFTLPDAPVLDLPAETRALYGDITGMYIQDVNLTPHFPLSAEITLELWKQQFGVEVDGVISIDPVTLGFLLKATGPITLPSGDVLTADNAVQLLLSDVYARYKDPADQDEFFAAAAGSVFSAVASGNVDPKALIEGLARAASEHRVLVWSAHDEDQAILADTTLAGGLPISDSQTQRFGVYLNDATGAKMDTYLDAKLGIGQVACRKDGRPTYGVSVTLINEAPADAATTLSDYVTGAGIYGVAPGNVKTLVSVYGPPETQNLGMTRDGKAAGYHPTSDSTYPVSMASVELAPGESTVLHFAWLGAKPFTGQLVTQATPVINLHETSRLALTCESPLW